MNYEEAFKQLYQSYLRTVGTLEHRKETIDHVIDCLEDVFIICYPDGVMLRGNEAASRLLNRPPADLGGENFQSLFDDSMASFVTSILERVDKSRTACSEMLVTKDFGCVERKYIYWTFQKVSFGASRGTQVLVILGKDQSELIRTQSQIANLLSFIPVGLLTITQKGDVLEPLSEYAKRIMRISDESKDKIDLIARLFPEVETQLHVRSQLKNWSTGAGTPYSIIASMPVESVIFGANGEPTYISLNYHPIQDARGVELIVMVMQDLTHLKQAELEARQAMKLARTDQLTKVKNRTALNEDLESIVRDMNDRSQSIQSLAVLMIDVDHFKLYNDTLGHLEGDACLKKIGQVLIDCTAGRESLAYRYGGEEFCVLMRNANISEAVQLARAINERLLQDALPHPKSSVSNFVTVSIGVAAMSQEEAAMLAPHDIIHAADKALYAAKHGGRNCYTVAQIDSGP